LKDVGFRNMYEAAIQNPDMLMQMMQMDPRFMDVLQELTGIDLNAMGEKKQADDSKWEDISGKAQEEQKKREAEAEAKRKAAEEAAMPSEERQKIQRTKDAEAIKLKGNDFYKKKDFETALKHYNEAREMNPAEVLFYSNIAACYIEQKDYDSAIEWCNKGVESTKGTQYDYAKLAKVIARKASALEKKGELEEALKTYATALLESNDSSIKDSMKRLEKFKKEKDIKDYIQPELAEAHKVKGTELFKAGDYPGAVKEYDEGLRRDPKNCAIFTNRAQAFIKLMQPNQGIMDAEKALAIDPKFIKGWIRKGTCHQMMKEYHKAMEAFDKGLLIDPNHKECMEGKNKTVNLIQSSSHASSGNDEERMRHAMADPEIQQIMQDPIIQQLLRDMQENPAAGQAKLKDPTLMAKIQKLIAAGVLKTA